MGAKKGNQNAAGHDGSEAGRKSAYQELQDATREFALMYDPQDIEIIVKKIKKKEKVSIREIMLLKEAGGNERLIAQHYGKVVPDKIDFEGDFSLKIDV